MGIGSNIKKYRIKSGLTQKELADRLNFTYQAISRWENDEAEPSISAVKELCKIFNCTTDELFDINKEESIAEVKENTYKCSQCGKTMTDTNDFIKKNEEFIAYENGQNITKTREVTLCKECNEINNLKKENEEKKKKVRKKIPASKRRVHSFIWPSILAVILIIVGIVLMTQNHRVGGAFCFINAVAGFTLLATLILNNTFITEMWLEVTSWGFVTLPGVIVEFSIDGFILLIIMKIALWILGILLAIATALLATFVCMVLSVFVYPYAIYKNFKGE